MILYLDTSALVKLYIEENGREAVVGTMDVATTVTTSVIAYAEARSAFARRRREGDLDDTDLARLVDAFDHDWNGMIRLIVTEPIAQHAGELAHQHALRGFDAIHLASALHADEEFGDARFLAFDTRLVAAAQNAGLALVPSGT